MPVQEIDCPNCGAHLNDYKPGTSFACQYCGTTVVAPPKNSWGPSQPNFGASHAPAVADPKMRRRIMILGVLAPVVMGGGITAFSLFQANKGMTKAEAQVEQHLAAVKAKTDLRNGASLPGVKSAERFRWDAIGGKPAPVTIGGQAAVIGRTRASDDSGSLRIEAFAAKDGAPLWRIEDLSDYSNAYRNVHFAVIGEFVMVSELNGTVHVHDLQNGARLRSTPLRERVSDFCVAEPGDDEAPAKLWVQLADKTSLLIDPKTGTSEAAKRPDWCVTTRGETRFPRHPSRNARGKKKAKPPKIEGTSVERVHEEGEFGVAVGHKNPGTKIPRLAGFDRKTRKQLWLRDAPSVDLGAVRMGSGDASALSEGRVVVIYGEGSEFWRFAGFDAKDGAPIFDERMPAIFAVDQIDWMTAKDGYAYIERTGGLEIRSMDDGKMRAMIGTLTYDHDMGGN